jgi:hypothetical protein
MMELVMVVLRAVLVQGYAERFQVCAKWVQSPRLAMLLVYFVPGGYGIGTQ